MNRRVCILNFGCKVNQAENLSLRTALQERGACIVDSSEAATDIVINTCSVTGEPEKKVRRLVARIARTNPQARLFLAGCYVDRDGEATRLMKSITGVFPNSEKSRIAQEIQPVEAMLIARMRSGRTRPILKIQDGCDLHCSFCIIPSLRGNKVRSLPMEEAARWISAQRSQPEIVLTGILLGAYGSDLTPRASLVDLLRRVSGNAPPIRLSSIEPWHLNPDLVELVGGAGFVRPHFHIPLQTCSESVARKMNRWLRLEQVEAIVSRLRELRPGAAIGTDLIVGFPGETAREFEETLEGARRLGFAYLHVFSFAPRPGAPASSLPDRLRPEVVHERSARLRALSRELNLAFRQRFLGASLDAVVLDRHEEEGSGQALTENYIRVSISKGEPPGAAEVRIVSASEAETLGAVERPRLESSPIRGWPLATRNGTATGGAPVEQ